MTRTRDPAAPESAFGIHDFGLSENEERRAFELHADAVIVDLMFHGACGYRGFTEDMIDRIKQHLAAHGDPLDTWRFGKELPERMALEGQFDEFRRCWDQSGITGGNRDISWHTAEGALSAFAHSQALYDGLPWLAKARSAADIRAAKARGEHATFLSTQDAGRFGSDLRRVRFAYEMGMRMVQLTYNSANEVGSGCTASEDGGLTAFGRRLVHTLNELGMLVDVSHCGARTSVDACSASDAPVIASHTSAAAVYPHARAKDDRVLEAIAQSGGIVGIYAVPFFLGPGSDTSIEDMLDHVDHLVSVVGADRVCLGLDWPLPLPKWALQEVTPAATGSLGFRPEDGLDDTRNLVGFDDYRDTPNITRGLVSRGYDDEQIRGILGENALRLIGEVIG
jgi:membrane dipeptidase